MCEKHGFSQVTSLCCLWGRYGEPLLWQRNDATGVWDCATDYAAALGAVPVKPSASLQPADSLQAAISSELEDANNAQGLAESETPAEDVDANAEEDIGTGASAAVTAEQAYEERLRRSMVQLEVDVPLVALADGVHASSFAGARRTAAHSPGSLAYVRQNRICLRMTQESCVQHIRLYCS